MIISRLEIKNWRNFRKVDVSLRDRQFVVGPNAAGKSNLLDTIRFLRDVARPEGGGLQKAVKDRGGVSKIRSLAARKDPEIAISIELSEGDVLEWRYELAFTQEARGRRQTVVSHERVYRRGVEQFARPDPKDRKDPERLTQTFLEQINDNKDFRDVAHFLQSITYLHIVPQLLRYADQIQGRIMENDPFGQGFLERVAKTPEKTRKSRLGRIEEALRVAVPQLKELEFWRDPITGRPHLQALYTHWRPNAGKQHEDQFSDGTLRLIGMFWSLLEGDSVLLLEEPELSLNSAVVAQMAPLIHRMQRSRRRQIIVSTHSEALLTEGGIDGREVLVLEPSSEGTTAMLAADIDEIHALLSGGLTVGEAVLPRTAPDNVSALSNLG